jgi:hypothetical protein
LGGLEPPTSCSTDRRSNQLSYNCILGRARKKGLPNGRETRCNAALWQGQAGGNIGRVATRREAVTRTPPSAAGAFTDQSDLDQARDFLGSAPHAKSPGWRPGLFFGTQKR